MTDWIYPVCVTGRQQTAEPVHCFKQLYIQSKCAWRWAKLSPETCITRLKETIKQILLHLVGCWYRHLPNVFKDFPFYFDICRVIYETGSNHFIIMQLVLFFTRLNFVYDLKHSFLFKPLYYKHQYFAGDKIEKNEKGWACGVYGWGEGCE